MNTEIVWSENLQAFIRRDIPGTRGYDKHFWEFVHHTDHVEYYRSSARKRDLEVIRLKKCAYSACQAAKAANKEHNRRDATRFLSDAMRQISRIYDLSQQAISDRARADFLASQPA